MASDQFSLHWDNFHNNMSSGMNSLLENEDLVDVTLAVEGKCLKAHKVVLSVCSPYFKELFKNNPCQHPIVFMKDVSYVALSDLLQFMYQGEVQVSQDNLTSFIKTAEALQIKGLTGENNVSIYVQIYDAPTVIKMAPKLYLSLSPAILVWFPTHNCLLYFVFVYNYEKIVILVLCTTTSSHHKNHSRFIDTLILFVGFQ